MKAAFHVAQTGRSGPVLVDVPGDIQEAELDFEYPEEVDLPGWKPPRRGHPRQIALGRRGDPRRRQQPVLYTGGGVVNGDASDELRELAELARLPVVTTLMAKSAFPETPRALLRLAGHARPEMVELAINKSDLLIAVGSRFDDRVTGKLSAFAPGAKVIHFDVDPAEIGKIREATSRSSRR